MARLFASTTGALLVAALLLPGSTNAFWGVPSTLQGRIREGQQFAPSSLSSPFGSSLSKASAASAVFSERPITSLSSQETKQAFDRLFVKFVRAGDEPMPEGDLDRALELAARGRSWSRAMKLLRLPNVKPTREHYHMAIQACKRADHKWRQALELLDEAVAKGLQPTATMFYEVMSICARSQRPKETVSILDRMAKAGIPAGLTSYNLAVSSLAYQGQWRKTLKIIQYMEKQAVWPNADTFTSAIDACGRAGEWQKALMLLEEMVKKNVPPTIATYNAAMTACRRGGQGDRAIAFLEEMIRKGLGCNADSFTIGIASCDSGKSVEQALELWSTMQEIGVEPTVGTVEALMFILGRTKQWAQAQEVIEGLPADTSSLPNQATGALALAEAIKSQGIVMDGPLAIFLTQTLLQGGRIQEAVRLVSDEDDHGILQGVETSQVPEVHALSLLVQWRRNRMGLSKAAASTSTSPSITAPKIDVATKEGDEELSSFRAVCEEGRLNDAIASIKTLGAKPRPSLVNLAMEYAILSRDYFAAKEILEIPGANSRAFYNRALRVAASSKRWGSVASLIKRMTQQEIVMDSQTFLELIQGSAEAGSLTRVQRYHHLMTVQGLPFEAAHYRSLMSYYNKAGKYALTLALSKEAGHTQADKEIYHLALEACARGGLWEEAIEIAEGGSLLEDEKTQDYLLQALAVGGQVEEVEKKVQAKPTLGGFNALLLAYKTVGSTDKVLAKLAELESSSEVKPNETTYEIVMESLSHNLQYEEAVKIYQKVQPPTAQAFRLALTAFFRLNRYNEAVALLKEMPASIEPSDAICKTAFKAVLGMGAKEALPSLQTLAATSA